MATYIAMSAFCKQHVGVRAVFRKPGDPDAAAELERTAIEHEGLVERPQNLAGRERRPIAVGPQQHEREFVAAKPRHHVSVTQKGPEPRGQLLEHAVARLVAERVVDGFEPVEVEDQQAERLARLLGGQNGVFEPIAQQDAIRQIRQRVVIREMHEPGFGLFAGESARRFAQLAFNGRNQPFEVAFHDVVVRP